MFRKLTLIFILSVPYFAKAQDALTDTFSARVKVVFIDSIGNFSSSEEHHYPAQYYVLALVPEQRAVCNGRIVLRVSGRSKFEKLNLKVGKKYDAVIVKKAQRRRSPTWVDTLPVRDCSELVLKEASQYIYYLEEVHR